MDLQRAQEIVNDWHYCDYVEQCYHAKCDCPCTVCFSYWNYNWQRFEKAEQVIAAARRNNKVSPP